MAFIHGKDTVVTVGGDDLSPFIKKSDFKPSRDTHDITHYGQTGHTYQGGLTDGSFSVDGTYDDGASSPEVTLTALLGSDPTGVTVVFQPEGAGAGKAQRSFTALLDSYDEADPVDNMVTWSASFKISGAVDFTPQS